jgi:hypothetical protein
MADTAAPVFDWLLRKKRTSGARPTRTPICIYVLWHPAFEDGPVLARAVAEWWGASANDTRAIGLGIPVYFRSAPWSADDALPGEPMPPRPSTATDPEAVRRQRLHVWRRPIELDSAEHNVFVPLVDDHMVDDPSWRRDLVELARLHHPPGDPLGDGPHVHLAPLQMTSAWARMPVEVSAIKALYVDAWRHAGDEKKELRQERRRQRVTRLLTQALVRLLRHSKDEKIPAEVFLSHAKADLELGPGVAEELRDVAASYGQIEVFYDENDLPSGGDWKRRMEGAARQNAGFIAVLSDHYATRYWCRREIQLARTPAPSGDEHPASHVWTVRPTVVAVTLDTGWSRLVGDLGAVPATRWRPDDRRQAALVLDQLFREALVAEFHRQYAEFLGRRVNDALGSVQADGVALLTWTPDAASLTRLRQAVDGKGRPLRLVAYPGHGFLPTEEEDLDHSLGPNVEFCSFEQLADRLGTLDSGGAKSLADLSAKPVRSAEPRASAPILGLLVGDADDLPVLGHDGLMSGYSLHVDSAVLRVARVWLQSGGRIAYGGTLRKSVSFTSLLMDAAAAHAQPRGPVRDEPAERVADPETPLENWLASFKRSNYTVRERAELAGLCRFHFIGPDIQSTGEPRKTALAHAEQLSEARKALATRVDLAIAIAGKRSHFSGFMPGVAEEICALMPVADASGDPSELRVLLVGEFGGITRQIIRYVLDPDLPMPSSLVLEKQLASGGLSDDLRGALADSDARKEAEARYGVLKRALDALRAIARREDNYPLVRLGMTVGQWKEIMTTSSIGHVRRILLDRVIPAARSVAGRSKGFEGIEDLRRRVSKTAAEPSPMPDASSVRDG